MLGLTPIPLHKHCCQTGAIYRDYLWLSQSTNGIITAAAFNMNINCKMLASRCTKHGLKMCLQNTHIAQLWHRLPTSWQEGAVSPSMFLLSFLWGKSWILLHHLCSLLSLLKPVCYNSQQLSAGRSALLLTDGGALGVMNVLSNNDSIR